MIKVILKLAVILSFPLPALCQEYPPVPEAPMSPPPVRSDTAILDAAEMSPEFPGGQAALDNFRRHNVRTKFKEAKNIQGEVLVGAVVEKDGTLTNIKIIQSLHPAYDNEAIRFVKMMPPWKPGSMELKPVRCRIKIPVKFGED